ncbi:MAG: cell division protein ZapA [Sterolibacterium sp.]|jgi:cell division protein ZapA
MSNKSTLDIKLQGRDFRVACAPDERESLLAAVALVDGKMAEIATRTKSAGERLAVMTALNLAHELLAKAAPETAATEVADASAASFDSEKFARRIGSIVARLDAAMVEQDKLF